MKHLNLSASVIDSRDIIDRLETLQNDRQLLQDAVDDGPEEDVDGSGVDLLEECICELKEWDEEFGEELKILQEVNSLGESVHDWEDGVTLISEDYWVDYCQELCKDIGDIPDNIPGYLAIDWDQTADNIKHDYSVIEINGIDYYYRD